jgi:hypothetical protein
MCVKCWTEWVDEPMMGHAGEQLMGQIPEKRASRGPAADTNRATDPFPSIGRRMRSVFSGLSLEMSFSKFKLLKSYINFTLIQERPIALVTLTVENDVPEKINYKI